MTAPFKTFSRFRREETGAALVEFGMILPLLLAFSAVVVEGGRLFWIYQSANAGVRDAARTLARLAPKDICPTGSVAGYAAIADDIVVNSIYGKSVIPSGSTVLDVVETLRCPTDDLPIVEVRATLRINLIWSGMFGTSFDTQVQDESRIYGV